MGLLQGLLLWTLVVTLTDGQLVPPDGTAEGASDVGAAGLTCSRGDVNCMKPKVINPCLDPDSTRFQCESGTDFIDLQGCRISDNDIGGGSLASWLDTAGQDTVDYLAIDSGRVPTTLPPELFRGLGSLKSLDLIGNILLQEGMFAEIGLLTDLGIHKNASLTRMPAGLFQELGQLSGLSIIGNKALTSLPEGVFAGLGQLAYLRINDSGRLTTLPAELFKGLNNLKILDLEQSALATLPHGIFKELVGLKELDLAHNPLQCVPSVRGGCSVKKSGNPLLNFFKKCGCPDDACIGCKSGRNGYVCPAGTYLFALG